MNWGPLSEHNVFWNAVISEDSIKQEFCHLEGRGKACEGCKTAEFREPIYDDKNAGITIRDREICDKINP